MVKQKNSIALLLLILMLQPMQLESMQWIKDNWKKMAVLTTGIVAAVVAKNICAYFTSSVPVEPLKESKSNVLEEKIIPRNVSEFRQYNWEWCAWGYLVNFHNFSIFRYQKENSTIIEIRKHQDILKNVYKTHNYNHFTDVLLYTKH